MNDATTMNTGATDTGSSVAYPDGRVIMNDSGMQVVTPDGSFNMTDSGIMVNTTSTTMEPSKGISGVETSNSGAVEPEPMVRGTQPNERTTITNDIGTMSQSGTAIPMTSEIKTSTVQPSMELYPRSEDSSTGLIMSVLIISAIFIYLITILFSTLLGVWGCKRQEKKLVNQGVQIPKISWFWLNVRAALAYTFSAIILKLLLLSIKIDIDPNIWSGVVDYLPNLLALVSYYFVLQYGIRKAGVPPEHLKKFTEGVLTFVILIGIGVSIFITVINILIK